MMLAKVILALLIIVEFASGASIRRRRYDYNPFDLELSRTTRAVDPIEFFKSKLSKLTSSARDLNGVSFQLGVLDGSINFDKKLAEMLSLEGVDIEKLKNFDKDGMLKHFGELKKIGAPIAKSSLFESVPILGDLVKKYEDIGDLTDESELNKFFSDSTSLLNTALNGSALEDPIKFIGEVIDFIGGAKGGKTGLSISKLVKSLGNFLGSKDKIGEFKKTLDKFNPLKKGLGDTPQGKLANLLKDGIEKLASDKLKSILPEEVNDAVDTFKKVEKMLDPNSNDENAVSEADDDEKEEEKKDETDPTKDEEEENGGNKKRGKCDRNEKPEDKDKDKNKEEDDDDVTDDLKDKNDPLELLKEAVKDIKDKLNPKKGKKPDEPKNKKNKKPDEKKPKAKKLKDLKKKAKDLGKKAKEALKKLKKCEKEKPAKSKNTDATKKASDLLKDSDLLKNGLNRLFRMFGGERHENSTVMEEVQKLMDMLKNGQTNGESEKDLIKKLLEFDKEKNLTDTLNLLLKDFTSASSLLKGFDPKKILSDILGKGKSALTNLIGDTVKKGFDKFFGCLGSKVNDALKKVKKPLEKLKELAGLKDKSDDIYATICKLAEIKPFLLNLTAWPEQVNKEGILKFAGLEVHAKKFSIAVKALNKIGSIFEYKTEIFKLAQDGKVISSFIEKIPNPTLKVNLSGLWGDWNSASVKLEKLVVEVEAKVYNSHRASPVPGAPSISAQPSPTVPSTATFFSNFIGLKKIDLQLPKRLEALEVLIPYSEFSEIMERVKRRLVRFEPMVMDLGEADATLQEMPSVFANIKGTIKKARDSESMQSSTQQSVESTTTNLLRVTEGTKTDEDTNGSGEGVAAEQSKSNGDEAGGIGTMGIVFIVIFIFFIAVSCFLIAFYFYRRRKDKKKDQKKKGSMTTSGSLSDESKGSKSKESGEEKKQKKKHKKFGKKDKKSKEKAEPEPKEMSKEPSKEPGEPSPTGEAGGSKEPATPADYFDLIQ